MTLVRIELMSSDAELEVLFNDGRTLTLTGPDHVSFVFERLADIVTIRPKKLASNADKHRGVPRNTEPDFPPLPPSSKAGVVEVSPTGFERYISLGIRP